MHQGDLRVGRAVRLRGREVDGRQVVDPDPAAVAREKLERTVREVVPEPEAAETARFLALLLGREIAFGMTEPELLE